MTGVELALYNGGAVRCIRRFSQVSCAEQRLDVVGDKKESSHTECGGRGLNISVLV